MTATAVAYHVFTCVGCDLLAFSRRSDALTCSSACRVRAHRNGSLQTLRVEAEVWDVPPAMIQQCVALLALCPEAVAQMEKGLMTVAEAQPHIWPKFLELVRKQVEATA